MDESQGSGLRTRILLRFEGGSEVGGVVGGPIASAGGVGSFPAPRTRIVTVVHPLFPGTATMMSGRATGRGSMWVWVLLVGVGLAAGASSRSGKAKRPSYRHSRVWGSGINPRVNTPAR